MDEVCFHISKLGSLGVGVARWGLENWSNCVAIRGVMGVHVGWEGLWGVVFYGMAMVPKSVV